MALYEACFLMRQDLSSQDVDKRTDEITKLIERNGGKVIHRESWGLRNLSYLVKKNRKAHYMMLVLDTPSAALKELEHMMRISQDVIRHLVVSIKTFKKGPSLMLSAHNKHHDASSPAGAPHPASRPPRQSTGRPNRRAEGHDHDGGHHTHRASETDVAS